MSQSFIACFTFPPSLFVGTDGHAIGSKISLADVAIHHIVKGE
jgi:hypothetical protein